MATSGAGGQFTKTCPKDWCEAMDKARMPYYLRIQADGYMQLTIIRPSPRRLMIRLIPRSVYFKGQAVSAETGAPLPGIGVALGVPGAISQEMETDAQGNFAFGPFDAFRDMSTQIIDAQPAELNTQEAANALVFAPWMIIQFGKGGDQFQDVTPPVKDGKDGRMFVPPLNMTSSVSDAVYTYVLLKLPKKGTAVTDVGKHVISEPRGIPAGGDVSNKTTSGETTSGESTSGTTGTTTGTGTGSRGPGTTPSGPASATSLTVQAGARRAQVGQTVMIPVWLIRGSGVANMNVTVAYDSAVARSEGAIIQGNLIGRRTAFEVNNKKVGIVKFGLAGRSALESTDGTLAQIPFVVMGKPGDKTALKVAVTDIGDVNGGVPKAATINGEILVVGPDGQVPGDSDGDGALTAADALNALKMSVDLIPVNLVCDINKDAKVTSTDARLIMQKVVGK
jgi:hypothetical protein